MAKERDDRYQSVGELVADLDRFLGDRTVRARALGGGRAFARSLRRNAVVIATTAILTLTLSILGVTVARSFTTKREPSHGAATTADPQAPREAAKAALEEAQRREGPQRLGLLATASIEDPSGPAGREARLNLAQALSDAVTERGASLAREELERLASGSDAVSARARLSLGRLSASSLDWKTAAGVLTPLSEDRRLSADERELAQSLSQFALALQPALVVGKARHVAVSRAGDTLTLILGSGAQLATYPLADAAKGTGLKAQRQWKLKGQLKFLGRGVRGELVAVVANRSTVQLGTLALETPTDGDPLTRTQSVKVRSSIQDIAIGDVNGDGSTDVCVLFNEEGVESFVLLGGRKKRRVLLYPETQTLGYSLLSVALADLDSDGNDEVVVGPNHGVAPEVEVLSLGNSGAFAPQARVPLAAVKRLVRVQGGVLAVVDYDQQTFEPAGQAPWLGRDGVYLIDSKAGNPAISGRWTYGTDTLSTTADRLSTSHVDAWPMRLDGKDWVARTYHENGDRPWHLELLPLHALRGSTPNPTPPISLTVREPPAIQAARSFDADGDGTSELVLNGLLHGIGDAQATPWKPTDVSSQLSRPRQLARATRQLQALGARDEAERLTLKELRDAFPDSWATREAAMGHVESLLAEADDLRAAGLHAFNRRSPDRGERLLDDATERFVKAAEVAKRQAQDPKSGVAPARGYTLAAYAWSRARDHKRAYQAAEQALALGLGPADVRTANAVRSTGRALAERKRLIVGFGSDSGSPVIPLHPLRSKIEPRGAKTVCSAGVEDGFVVPLTLRSQPLAVEAELRLDGSAWLTHVNVGVFERDEHDRPVNCTGVQLGLWNVYTKTLSVTALLRGVRQKLSVDLPTYSIGLKVRLETYPLHGGGTGMRLEVHTLDGRLLYVGENVSKSPVGPLARGPGPVKCYAGLVSPASTHRDATVEQAQWPLMTAVTLTRVSVEAPQASVEQPTGLFDAHWKLGAGRYKKATQAYDALLNELPRATEAVRWNETQWFRAFARSGSGDPNGWQDLVRVARSDPYHALLWFEDLAEVLPLSGRQYLPLVGAAIRAMSQDSKFGWSVAVALSLVDDPRTKDLSGLGVMQRSQRLARDYITMRRVGDTQRWSPMNAYRKLEPGARLPRMKLPQVLDVPESLSAEDFDTLLMAETSNYLTYKNLWKAWCGRDDTLVPAKLAAFLLNARLSGQAAYWARRWKHNGVREEQLMLKKLATCYSNMGQRELFYQTLQRLLDTGYAKSGLKTFERLHGADPRFQELADK